jgi:predicted acyl esterase
MRNSVVSDNSVAIEVRDGTILRANIYRLDDGKKHPAILIRTPYTRPDAEIFNLTSCRCLMHCKPVTQLLLRV